MDNIITAFVDAGYYRARINTLSEFDKIVGGMAWALQVFSYDVNIDVFFADTLDLGQKIALTERLVMLLIVMRCPFRVEPHQIVGLDHANLLPCIQWLLKRSEEVRREHEAFNRLLALRHYNRVTDTGINTDRSKWCHTIPVTLLKRSRPGTVLNIDGTRSHGHDATRELKNANDLIDRLNEEFKDTKVVSFVQLPSLLRAANLSGAHNLMDYRQSDNLDFDELKEYSDEENDQGTSPAPVIVEDDKGPSHSSDLVVMNDEERLLHEELDTELLATNQKILNLCKKLDEMPSELEINQYKRRYIELHQELIGKNKDVKKLFDLYNSLDSTRHYLQKEINLLDSIAVNFELTANSATNRDSFMLQLNDIIDKIELVLGKTQERRDSLKERCENLNVEYGDLFNHIP